jgi:hypothetical protein
MTVITEWSLHVLFQKEQQQWGGTVGLVGQKVRSMVPKWLADGVIAFKQILHWLGGKPKLKKGISRISIGLGPWFGRVLHGGLVCYKMGTSTGRGGIEY